VRRPLQAEELPRGAYSNHLFGVHEFKRALYPTNCEWQDIRVQGRIVLC